MGQLGEHGHGGQRVVGGGRHHWTETLRVTPGQYTPRGTGHGPVDGQEQVSDQQGQQNVLLHTVHMQH